MNEKIRIHAQKSKVKLWQVAEIMGIHDSKLSKMLRHELPKMETEKILTIIDDLANGAKKEGEDDA